MLRKCLFAASLVVLAAGGGRPAGADPKFLEEYGGKFGGGGDSTQFGFDGVGKFTVWGGYRKDYAYVGPVISIVGRYRDIDRFQKRYDVLVAADQQVTRNLYVTGNAGYANQNPDFGSSTDDFVFGFGATWVPMPRWS